MLATCAIDVSHVYEQGNVYTLPKALADSWIAYGTAESVARDPRARETKDA